jgi:hypothetical protein
MPIIEFPSPPARSAFKASFGAGDQVTFGSLPPRLLCEGVHLYPVMRFPGDEATRERLFNAIAAAVWVGALQSPAMSRFSLAGTAAAHLGKAPQLDKELKKQSKTARGHGLIAGFMLYFILQCAAADQTQEICECYCGMPTSERGKESGCEDD